MPVIWATSWKWSIRIEVLHKTSPKQNDSITMSIVVKFECSANIISMIVCLAVRVHVSVWLWIHVCGYMFMFLFICLFLFCLYLFVSLSLCSSLDSKHSSTYYLVTVSDITNICEAYFAFLV